MSEPLNGPPSAANRDWHEAWRRFLEWAQSATPGPYAAWWSKARLEVRPSGEPVIHMPGHAGPRLLAQRYRGALHAAFRTRVRILSTGRFPHFDDREF